MTIEMKKIYESYINGDSLSDDEIIKGFKFFSQLTQDLNKCGPVFKLSANEANRIANGLSYIHDRINKNT